MTRIGLFVFAAALFLSGAGASQAQWSEFKPQGEGFRVELPGRPGTDIGPGDKDIGSTRVTVSRFVQRKGSAYHVYFVRRDDFAPGVLSGDPQKLFDLERDLFAKTWQVISEKRLTTNGAPARYLVLRGESSVTIGSDGGEGRSPHPGILQRAARLREIRDRGADLQVVRSD